jgi:hypothetical protein
MAIGILAAALAVLIAAACIGIPQLVRVRHQQRDDDDDALAYEKELGRSAQDIARDNAAMRKQQESEPRSERASGSG